MRKNYDYLFKKKKGNESYRFELMWMYHKEKY